MSEKISAEILLPIAVQLFTELTPSKNSSLELNTSLKDKLEERAQDFINFYHQLKAGLERDE